MSEAVRPVQGADRGNNEQPTFLAWYDNRTNGLADMDIVNSSGQILQGCPRCQYSATSKTAGGISKVNMDVFVLSNEVGIAGENLGRQ